jgi:hypothetical protein
MEGKKTPMVCNFLSRMSALARTLYFPFPGLCYLFEGRDFRNRENRVVGLGIAFRIIGPAFV